MVCLDFEVIQYPNITTVLTREYLDVRPDGWLDYAALRIAQLYDPRRLLLICFACIVWYFF